MSGLIDRFFPGRKPKRIELLMPWNETPENMEETGRIVRNIVDIVRILDSKVAARFQKGLDKSARKVFNLWYSDQALLWSDVRPPGQIISSVVLATEDGRHLIPAMVFDSRDGVLESPFDEWDLAARTSMLNAVHQLPIIFDSASHSSARDLLVSGKEFSALTKGRPPWVIDPNESEAFRELFGGTFTGSKDVKN